jgi:hypothetical protein
MREKPRPQLTDVINPVVLAKKGAGGARPCCGVDEAAVVPVVWSGRELSVGTIGRCDEEHGADEATRAKSHEGDAERPAQSIHQKQARKIGRESASQ